MEKRKAIGLKGYFTRTLLLFFIGIIGIFAAAFILLLLCMEAGIVAPANAGETEARTEIARQRELDAFSGDLTPSFYDYIYFDGNGAIKASSLEGDALTKEASLYEADNVTYGTGVYVYYEDGSRCLFTWRYVASYTNRTLRKILPGAEPLTLLIAGAASILFFLLFVRRMGRKLGTKLSLVESASEQIARQDLDTLIPSSAGIREFNRALESMDDMRGNLKDALIRQWKSEQQRKQEIAALAHDMKTPLTVINGNAELLLEDPLTEEQARLVNSIHGAGMRARQYVHALQQVSNLDIDSEEHKKMSIPSLLDELDAALSPLARDQSVTMEYVYGEDLRDITVSPMLLVRALVNIGENAIRFTSAGGRVTITVCQNPRETLFRIQDQGPGFSKSALQHATEMFWQQEKSWTGGNNYGIGLSIADKVAQKHAGQLILENTARGGCVKLIIATQDEQE